ncbi:hypothetical protein BC833DRAFT_566472 [Globomyces pollinis-pini]|nr:hypothetical protein BC833DRAFT_566472 [Globomyces pollinis-pini]KAJ2995606.1 hypothetical protein HDV02_000608 [Globomyces sp. JEL0801]
MQYLLFLLSLASVFALNLDTLKWTVGTGRKAQPWHKVFKIDKNFVNKHLDGKRFTDARRSTTLIQDATINFIARPQGDGTVQYQSTKKVKMVNMAFDAATGTWIRDGNEFKSVLTIAARPHPPGNVMTVDHLEGRYPA